jgi:hypothetical protein
VAKKRLGRRVCGGLGLGGGKIKHFFKSPCERKTRSQGDFLLKKTLEKIKKIIENVLTKSNKYYIIKLKKGGEKVVDKEQENLLRLGMELIQTGAAIIAVYEWMKRKNQQKRGKPSKPHRRAKRKRR